MGEIEGDGAGETYRASVCSGLIKHMDEAIIMTFVILIDDSSYCMNIRRRYRMRLGNTLEYRGNG